MTRRVLRWLIPAALTMLFVTIAARGLDFGYHWDEDALIDKVEWSVTAGGVLLPPTYDWPSATFWVALLALAPDVTRVSGVEANDFTALEAGLVRHIRTSTYRLRLRWLLLIGTALSVFWVFLASRALGGGLLEASIAAAILATAWETGYHARFAVPDGLLMQFGALTLWCTAMAVTRRGSRWDLAAAAAAGLAIGTKYSAFPLLVPVLALAVWTVDPWRARVQRVAQLIGAAIVAFLVTTPGALFMPLRFVQALVRQWTHYQTGHGVHTVSPGADHLWRMLEYLGLVLLAPYPVIAALLALLAIAGVAYLARSSPRMAIAVAAFPVAYVLYFSVQRVMFVRNLIIVAPFLAVAAARGVTGISAAVPNVVAQRSAAAIMLAVAAASALFGVRAADSIRTRHNVEWPQAAHQWLEAETRPPLGVSPRVRALLPAPTRTTADERTATQWLTFVNEPVCGRELPANYRGLVTLVAGPREVNLDYYPGWAGDSHLVVVDLSLLKREGFCEVPVG